MGPPVLRENPSRSSQPLLPWTAASSPGLEQPPACSPATRFVLVLVMPGGPLEEWGHSPKRMAVVKGHGEQGSYGAGVIQICF